nr:RhuM family protein [Halomonas socia]
MSDNNQTPIIIYQAAGQEIEVRLDVEQDTVWLTQRQMAELFSKDVRTVNEHLLNVYSECELERDSTIRKFRIVRREGAREVTRNIEHYNLDAIISVGYRVKSPQGIRFRQWSTRVLREHLTQGWTLSRQRFAEQGGIKRLDAMLDHHLDEVLKALNDARWEVS